MEDEELAAALLQANNGPSSEGLKPSESQKSDDYESKGTIEFSSLDFMQQFIKAAKITGLEADIVLDETGFWCRQMDASHVALLDVLVPPSAIQKWHVPLKVKFGIRLDELDDTVKRIAKLGNDTWLELELREHDTLYIRGRGNDNRNKEFVQLTVETGLTDCPLPKLDFPATIVLRRKALVDILEDVESKSEQVKISASHHRDVVFSGKSDAGSVRIPVSTSDLVEVNIPPNSTVQQDYSLSYMLPIVKALGTEVVKLCYGNKMPLRMEFPVGSNDGYDGDYTGSHLHFYLAPRVYEA